MRLGDLKNAVKEFELDIDISPEKVFSHFDLGMLLKAGGKLINAKEHLEVALKLNPEYAYTCVALQEIYELLGQPELFNRSSCVGASGTTSVQTPQSITEQ
jgi:tetratricopeptide (TPR) repeat protein